MDYFKTYLEKYLESIVLVNKKDPDNRYFKRAEDTLENVLEVYNHFKETK